MQVTFDNTADNWLKWGQIVRRWVANLPGARPQKVSNLLAQMTAQGITGGSVPNFGPGDTVHFESYNSQLKFFLPTEAQVAADEAELDAIAAGGPGLAGPLRYPLPSFYPTVFGALEVNLSQPVMREIGLRRLGEYVIQECQ